MEDVAEAELGLAWEFTFLLGREGGLGFRGLGFWGLGFQGFWVLGFSVLRV